MNLNGKTSANYRILFDGMRDALLSADQVQAQRNN